MIRSKTINDIAHEITDNLHPYIFEIFTEERNMDVVEYILVEDELSKFCYYEQYYWKQFRDGSPKEEGYYWLTVIDDAGKRKVVLTKWYSGNSYWFYRNKYKSLIAWKRCIMPDPYED